MTDVVVTVPKMRWADWIEEGDLAVGSEPAIWEGSDEYGFALGGHAPMMKPAECVYIVAHGYVRGYSPLQYIDPRGGLRFGGKPGSFALVRRGGAVAVTLRSPEGGPLPVRGFQGWRYRWWNYDQEMSFPSWKTYGVEQH